MLHVTVAYPVTDDVRLLERSSIKNGLDFVLINKSTNGTKATFIDKLSFVKEFISSIHVDKASVVMITDAYDVLILEHRNSILSKFYSLGCDILFSAESNFWPPENEDENRKTIKRFFDEEHRSKWRYINAGAYMGYVWAVEKMLDFCTEYQIKTGHHDDQLIIQQYYYNHIHSNEVKLKVDENCLIFGSLYGSLGDYYLDRFRVINSLTHNTISVAHSNGDKVKGLNFLRFYGNIYDNNNAELNLYFVRSVDGYLSLSNNKNILYISKEINSETVFMLVKGDKYGIVMSSTGNIITFRNDFSLSFDASAPRDWEVIDIRSNFLIDKSRYVSDYIDNFGADQLFLVPIPIIALCNIYSDKLCSSIKNTYRTINGKSYYF